MQAFRVLPGIDPAQLVRFAEEVAFIARKGDCLALAGELGAGKTTFARAFIRALANDETVEIPSPTFTLVQAYDTPRTPVWHFDLYRLQDEAELGELGLDEAVEKGVALVEWPERAGGRLPADRLEIRFEDRGAIAAGDGAGVRDVVVRGHGAWAERADRLMALREVIRAAETWRGGDCRLAYIQGDASVRRYGRIRRDDGSRAIVMDWPRQPDGPPIRDGKPYSRIAGLAEGVRPFVAVADALRSYGLHTPRIHARDLDRGLLLLDDFGDDTFGAVLSKSPRRGAAQAALWGAAVDVLLAIRGVPAPESLPLPNGGFHELPPYDRQALGIETELLADWYWPAVFGAPIVDDARATFIEAWGGVFDRVLAMPRGWVLRDFHSPNLMWIAGADEGGQIGLLDFQDALHGPPAYDLVSLLQDARVDVPEALEAELFERYCSAASAREPGFDRDAFAFSYAALGAQRNTKILGIFARLARRDGKTQYLAHIPRIWRYLERDLAKPGLSELRLWYDRHLPPEARSRPLARGGGVSIKHP